MYLIGFLILLVAVYFYYSGKKKRNAPQKPGIAKELNSGKNQSSNGAQGEGTSKSFLPAIPTGYQIFAKNLLIAGIQHRKVEALKFARASNQELSLQRDPSNKFDPNAIKLIGLSGATEYFIGFLPKELSAQIIGTELFDSLKARLGRIYISKNDFLDIQYQVIGPKADKKRFDEFLSNQPADSSQKDYFEFFAIPIPKGLTAGQAGQTMTEHRKASKAEEQAEWDGYISIVEEFDDKDFRECNDLKKVSRTVLMEVLNQLKADGKTYKYLSDNIDEIVEKLIELKPDLEKQT